jgi:hypothetical protein
MESGTAGLISGGFSAITSTVTNLINANQERKLQEYLSKLSLEQKERLETQLIQAQTQADRERILFQRMALDKNLALTEKLEKDKYFSFIVVGIGIIMLATVVYLVKKK